MFFRVKSAGSRQYLQIVKSSRQGKKVRQQVYATLGRLDELKTSGQLEGLIRSGLRHCEKFTLIDAHATGQTEPVTVLRIMSPTHLILPRSCGLHGIHAFDLFVASVVRNLAQTTDLRVFRLV